MPHIVTPRIHDVCVVGSGAGGGIVGKVLTEAGADVVMLEAGPLFFSEEDSAMFAWNYASPRRGAATPERPFGEFNACYGGWDIEGEPYTHAEGADEWAWFRGRMLGGRTNHWGRISLRYGPNDFKRRSIDGEGDDWPIEYKDIAPYYDRLDRLIGVFGSNEGMYNEPDGIFLPPPRPRCYELLVQKTCSEMGIPCVSSRLSVLTKPLNGRAACHYCGQCERGCATNSNFSSPSVLVRPALETGKLTLVPNAMCREVLTDDEGRATGVSYVDTQTLEEKRIRARVVLLAASTCETARLLLNSKSPRHPNGLANSSDVVGRYLMDTTSSGVSAVVPSLMNNHPHNEDGVGGMHVYVPWWLDEVKLDFLRGYHIEVYGGRGMPGYGFLNGIHGYNGLLHPEQGGGGYGRQLKDDYRSFYGSLVHFSAEGEMIARRENRCEIDPDFVDRYGIPVLRFDVRWSDEEYRQVKHAQETMRTIMHEMGGTTLDDMPSEEDGYGIRRPGEDIHEVGTTRMGADPRHSVLNANCQAHDCENLFIADGGPFVTVAHKNPTWTIMALAWRTADHIRSLRSRGSLR